VKTSTPKPKPSQKVKKVKPPKVPPIHAYMPHSIQKFSLDPKPLGRKKIRAFNQGLKNLGLRRNILIDENILINEEEIVNDLVSKATMIKKLEALKERLPDHVICNTTKSKRTKEVNWNK